MYTCLKEVQVGEGQYVCDQLINRETREKEGTETIPKNNKFGTS